jgi:hypothetical protein
VQQYALSTALCGSLIQLCCALQHCASADDFGLHCARHHFARVCSLLIAGAGSCSWSCRKIAQLLPRHLAQHVARDVAWFKGFGGLSGRPYALHDAALVAMYATSAGLRNWRRCPAHTLFGRQLLQHAALEAKQRVEHS